MEARKCGCKKDRYDPRDFMKKYSYSDIPQAGVAPSKRNHSKCLIKYVDHVYDQGHLGSCTANAVCAAYGLDLKKEEQTLPGGYSYFNPSRLFLYYNTRDDEGTTWYDSGASIRDTVKDLNRRGVCPEIYWPYDIKKFKEQPPKQAYDAAVGNNLCKYERLNQEVDQFRACLNDDCPFVFGFNVYPSFYKISKDGVMPIPTESERKSDPQGRHAVMAVGFSDTKKCIIVLNSWGQDWGRYGYFYMPYAFIQDPSMCFDFWKISFACQRGKPRPADSVTWKDVALGKTNKTYYGTSLGSSSYDRGGYARKHETSGVGVGGGLYWDRENNVSRASPSITALPNSHEHYRSEVLGTCGGSNLWSGRVRMNVSTHSDLNTSHTALPTNLSTLRWEDQNFGHHLKPANTYNFRTGRHT